MSNNTIEVNEVAFAIYTILKRIPMTVEEIECLLSSYSYRLSRQFISRKLNDGCKEGYLKVVQLDGRTKLWMVNSDYQLTVLPKECQLTVKLTQMLITRNVLKDELLDVAVKRLNNLQLSVINHSNESNTEPSLFEEYELNTLRLELNTLHHMLITVTGKYKLKEEFIFDAKKHLTTKKKTYTAVNMGKRR